MKTLTSKLDSDGRVVVQNARRELAGLGFCRPGVASDLATKRYREILKNQDGSYEGRP
jgi:hypothetical protein